MKKHRGLFIDYQMEKFGERIGYDAKIAKGGKKKIDFSLDELIKIKFLAPKRNQVKGFGVLINTPGCSLSSYKKNMYLIQRKYLQALDDNNIKYTIVK